MFEPTNPQNAAIIEKLTDLLSAMSVGAVQPYSYFTVKNGVGQIDLQGKHRYLFVTARERVEKAHGCIFETVRGLGIKRLSASESPEIGLASIRAVRRKARRGFRRLERINSNSLSDGERKRVIAYGSLLGAITLMADGNKVRTLAAVADPAKPIPPKDILQMFAT